MIINFQPNAKHYQQSYGNDFAMCNFTINFEDMNKSIAHFILILSYILTLLFCISVQMYAQQIPSPTGRTYELLSPNDTLMMTVGEDGQKFIYHPVKQGQTLYSISKYYKVSMSMLKYHNPALEEGLSNKKTIKIPIAAPAIKRVRDSTFNDRLNVPIYYQVRRGETVYRISKVYTKTAPALFRLHNPQIKNDILGVGDTVLIGWMSVYGLAQVKPKYEGPNAPIFEASDRLKENYLTRSLKREVHAQKGVAAWKHRDGSQITGNLFCLHRKAPLNTIVKITNPMNKQTIYAKVIGRVPKVGYDQTVIAVLSTDAARGLGALDPRFYVNLVYLD